MRTRTLIAALAIGALPLLGCAPPPYAVYDAPATVAQRVEYGYVEAIDWFRDGQSSPTGLGAVVGGVAGGVIGHQFGAGRGNTAATIAGAIGGALVGNQIERANERDRYRVIVRLDNGGTLTVSDIGEGELRVGDRVRIVNNRVYRS